MTGKLEVIEHPVKSGYRKLAVSVQHCCYFHFVSSSCRPSACV